MMAVFLRGIAHVPMAPLRDKLTRAGLKEVRSFGATGNFVFDIDAPPVALEELIEDATGSEAFVRTRAELESIVRSDPYAGLAGAGVFLAKAPIPAQVAARFTQPGFDGPAPVIDGAVVYLVYPIHRPGKQANIDFERELGVRGTMRASRVVARVASLMQA